MTCCKEEVFYMELLIVNLEKLLLFRDLRFELPQASATGTIAVDFLEHALRKITSTGHFNVTMSAVSVVISSIDRLGFLLAPGISDQNAENILNPYEIQHQDLVRRLAAAILEWCGRTMPRCMMNKSGYQSYTIADPTELQASSVDRKSLLILILKV